MVPVGSSSGGNEITRPTLTDETVTTHWERGVAKGAANQECRLGARFAGAHITNRSPAMGFGCTQGIYAAYAYMYRIWGV